MSGCVDAILQKDSNSLYNWLKNFHFCETREQRKLYFFVMQKWIMNYEVSSVRASGNVPYTIFNQKILHVKYKGKYDL